MKLLLFIVLVFSSVLGSSVRAEIVVVDYALTSAEATIDSFTVPNPQGGADITISPSINLDSGSFESRFFEADAAGVVSNGDASIIGMEFSGDLVMVLSSTVDIFGFPVPVSATISGPITASQQTDSSGSLAGLSLYVETSPGAYDFSAGPLDCNDSAFGVFCTAIEAVLGAEFPIDGIDSSSALPFSGGTFSDVNPPSGSLGSDVTADVDFSFPLADGISFGATIDTSWEETGRVTLIPEPSVSILGICSLIAMFGVRRRRVSVQK